MPAARTLSVAPPSAGISGVGMSYTCANRSPKAPAAGRRDEACGKSLSGMAILLSARITTRKDPADLSEVYSDCVVEAGRTLVLCTPGLEGMDATLGEV